MKIGKLVLILLVLGGLVVYNPGILKNPQIEAQINSWKQRFKQPKPIEMQRILGITNEVKNTAQQWYKEAMKDQKIPGLPKEIMVDEYVKKLTEQVKALPKEQLLVVKKNFCRDVIDVATQSAGGE